MVVPVGADNQSNGDEVVSEHLPVVFATFLNVDHKDLLKPEAQLSEGIELMQRAKLAVRPIDPEILQNQPGRRGVVYVL